MATDYILVDYENVRPNDVPVLDPARHRVFVFRGSQQTKLDFALAEALQPLGRRVEYVRVVKNGRNALDFQLAFHVGRLLERHAAEHPGDKARFIIVSNDNGYDALLEHIRSLGHVGVKASSIRDGLAIPAESSGTATGDRALVLAREHLRKSDKNRPATRAALVRHMATRFKGSPDVDAETVVRALEEAGTVVTVGTKVRYP